MKADLRRLLFAGLLGLLAILLWAVGFVHAKTLARAYDGVSVRLEQATLTQRQLEQAASQAGETDVVLRAAWSRGAAEQATSELNGKTSLRKVAVYGDMRRVMAMRLLSGAYPTQDDAQGCLIDSASARALFQAVDPIGAQVTLQSGSYLVRGVAEAYEPVLMVCASKAQYTNLEFSAPAFDTAAQSAKTFLFRCNSNGGEIVLESGLLVRVLYGCFTLPPCLLTLAVAIRLIGRGRREGITKRQRALALAGGALLACAALVILANGIYLPQAWLPTKWSDFSFWSRFAEGWRKELVAYSLMTPLPKDIPLFQSLRAGAWHLVLSALFGGWSLSLCRGKAPREAGGENKAQAV